MRKSLGHFTTTSDTFEPMTELSFATTVEAESDESSDDEEIEAEPNETCDIYLSGGDGQASAGAALDAMPVPDGAKYTDQDDDGNKVLRRLKIKGSDNLEDVDRLLEKYHDAEPQQKLFMVYALMKSTFGAMTANKNKHSVGLKNGEPNTEGNFASYSDHYRNLEAINWSSLAKEERELFESISVDAGDLGFDPKHRGPKLMVVNGDRLPVVATEGDEHKQLLSILADLPEVPSYDHEDDGFVESSDPSVFDAELDNGGDLEEASEMADNLDSDDEADDEEDLKLASNPKRITEATTTQLKSGVNNLTNITNSRVLMKMKSHEENRNEGTRSSVVDRLEERIAAEGKYGDDEDSNADGEADGEDITIEQVEVLYDFSDIEMDAVKQRANNGSSISEAAKTVSNA